MPPSYSATAQATTSCQRCHRRKKKCDRALPQCENCRVAQASCSFLEDDHQVGSYPIAFVQSLETRIRDLEMNLASALNSSHTPTNEQVMPDNLQHEGSGVEDLMVDDDCLDYLGSSATNIIPDNPSQEPWPQPGSGPSPSLPEELKWLSLEATAERHLGSSSGFSFARLTQTVLRRLSPDRADFVFGNDDETDEQTDYNSPSDPLYSIFYNFNNSISCYPNLFGTLSMSDITEPEDFLSGLRLPDESHVNHLVHFYFAHSHTLYPILHRGEFMSVLQQVRSNDQSPLAQSPLCLFRIWMVLAIGSTTYCSVTLVEESESMLYYNKAMLYFEAALGYGDMAALEVLMLQVSYSFFNQLGPNTWILVGLAARMAVGMGLHTSSTYDSTPALVVEARKRVFFSIYMMDRVVSVALGRPFALHDDDIDILPFVDVDDDNIELDGGHSRDALQPSIMAIPLHILALRKIASKISRTVYSIGTAARTNAQEREAIVTSIHKELIDWRRNMPFPLPDSPHVPHLSSSWYDFNFYTHLTMLYRPSPLFPTLDQARVKILAEAAAISIRQAVNMHRQQRFAYNWLNLLAIFTSALSLIYAVTAQPDNLVRVLRESKAIDDLELAMELLDTLSLKFTAAKKTRRMIEQIVRRYKDLCSDVPIGR